MLERLTFTGIDEQTPFGQIAALVDRYPRVEFGVLVGDSTPSEPQVEPTIFPSLPFVYEFAHKAAQGDWNIAIHLCGEWARAAVRQGTTSRYQAALVLCRRFNRVQINLHPDYFTPGWIEPRAGAVIGFARDVACRTVILQHRGDWCDVPVHHHKVEYLWDRSGGAGRASFEEWPRPIVHPWRRQGYAGGIGPQTIGRTLAFVDEHDSARLWLDMEGRVRRDGLLDMAIVSRICEAVWGGGDPSRGGRT